jgi:hypothetical protein
MLLAIRNSVGECSLLLLDYDDVEASINNPELMFWSNSTARGLRCKYVCKNPIGRIPGVMITVTPFHIEVMNNGTP